MSEISDEDEVSDAAKAAATALAVEAERIRHLEDLERQRREQRDLERTVHEEERRRSMADIERKKLEVEQKKKELEKKMQQVERRQRELEARRLEREREDRENREREEAKSRKAVEEKKAELEQRQENEFFASENDREKAEEAAWDTLRKKQSVEEEKRKELKETRTSRAASRASRSNSNASRASRSNSNDGSLPGSTRSIRSGSLILEPIQEVGETATSAQEESCPITIDAMTRDVLSSIQVSTPEMMKRPVHSADARSRGIPPPRPPRPELADVPPEQSVSAPDLEPVETMRKKSDDASVKRAEASLSRSNTTGDVHSSSLSASASEEGVAPPSPLVPKGSKTATTTPTSRRHKRSGSFFRRKEASENGTSETPLTLKATRGSSIGEKSSSTGVLTRLSMGVKSALGKSRGSIKGLSSKSLASEFAVVEELSEADMVPFSAALAFARERYAADRQEAEKSAAALKNRCEELVEGKRVEMSPLPEECKMYWVDPGHERFDNWRHDDNAALLNPDWNETLYAGRMRDQPHRIHVAIDEKLGPAVLIYCTEPDEAGDQSLIFWSDRGLKPIKVSIEVWNMMPRPEEDRERMMLVQRLLEEDVGVSPAIQWRLAGREAIKDELAQLEQSLHSLQYKFGVLYARPGQTQNEMFANVDPHTEENDDYNRFLSLLGDRIELQGWTSFRGGLDVKHNHTGTKSVYTKHTMAGDVRNVEFEIMFHVATMLPHSAKDEQQLERKRHLGNDICVIIWLDGGSLNDLQAYDPSVIKSEFNHAFILVQPVVGVGYRVRCIYKSGVDQCNPYLPGSSYVFPHSQDFRRWLLAKCVNSERISYQCLTFSQKLRRTRKVQLQLLIGPELETK